MKCINLVWWQWVWFSASSQGVHQRLLRKFYSSFTYFLLETTCPSCISDSTNSTPMSDCCWAVGVLPEPGRTAAAVGAGGVGWVLGCIACCARPHVGYAWSTQCESVHERFAFFPSICLCETVVLEGVPFTTERINFLIVHQRQRASSYMQTCQCAQSWPASRAEGIMHSLCCCLFTKSIEESENQCYSHSSTKKWTSDPVIWTSDLKMKTL